MTSYLFLAPGFEEIEALATVDVLRRGGMDVKTVSITESTDVEGTNGITVKADMLISNADLSSAEWLIVPGGMPGAENLHKCARLNDALLAQHNRKGGIAAICAAPAVVLAPLGLLDGRKATCYPGFENACSKAGMDDVRVSIDGHLITSNGPSSAILFGLAILKASKGAAVSEQVGQGLLLRLSPDGSWHL